MAKEPGGIQETWVSGRGREHGSNPALELRPEQFVLSSEVSVEGGAPHPGFARDVTDAYFTVRPVEQKLHEGRINLFACPLGARVFGLFPAFFLSPMRDTCRILFRNCHVIAVSCCAPCAGFIASPQLQKSQAESHSL